MGTSQSDIREWLERGKSEGTTHMIVACDTFDYSDYPVYVKSGQDARKYVDNLRSQQMTSVMEVYSYAMDLEKQISEHRAWNCD